MNKPILPTNPTKQQIIEWEKAVWAYEDAQIELLNELKSKNANRITKCRQMGHTIDRLGRRVIFRVTNSRNAKRHFDRSSDAVEFARTAVNQPTKLTIMPVYPENMFWATPIMELVRLIKESENES